MDSSEGARKVSAGLITKVCRTSLTTDSSFIADDLISIELQDGGTFTVQKAVLSRASEYFRKALDGRFLESHDRTLHLPGCSTTCFELILFWLVKLQLPYLGDKLEDECGRTGTSRKDVSKDARAMAVILVELWITCDMLLIPALQNDAARKLASLLCVFGCAPEATRVAFAATPFDSPLRRLLIACFMHRELPYRPQPQEDHGALNELGGIPGFLAALLKATSFCAFPACQLAASAHQDHKIPDDEDFMVPESRV